MSRMNFFYVPVIILSRYIMFEYFLLMDCYNRYVKRNAYLWILVSYLCCSLKFK